MILLHSLRTLDPESKHALIGHSLNVSTMHYSPKRRRLISGSWDRTARVWAAAQQENPDAGLEQKAEGWETELVLEAHEEAVWGVLAIDDGPPAGGWLTASGEPLSTEVAGIVSRLKWEADRLIYLWGGNGELFMRFKGSPEPVRGLCPLHDAAAGFASACNDGCVYCWALTLIAS